MLAVAKSEIFEVRVWKIFGGEVLITTLATTPLQIFCKKNSNSQVIVKNVIDSDDNFSRNSY